MISSALYCTERGRAPNERELLQFSWAFLCATATGRVWIVMSRVFLILPGLFLQPLPIWPHSGVHWSLKAEWAENVVLILIFKQIWHLHLTWGRGNENQTWNHQYGNAKHCCEAGKAQNCSVCLAHRHKSIKDSITPVWELLFRRTLVHSFLDGRVQIHSKGTWINEVYEHFTEVTLEVREKDIFPLVG